MIPAETPRTGSPVCPTCYCAPCRDPEWCAQERAAIKHFERQQREGAFGRALDREVSL